MQRLLIILFTLLAVAGISSAQFAPTPTPSPSATTGYNIVTANDFQLGGVSSVGQYIVIQRAVDFNSGNTDTTFVITLPTNFTWYRIAAGFISSASGTLTTATFGMFSGANGTGTTLVTSGTAVTVTTSAINTNNNMQLFSPVNGTTMALTFSPIYFRMLNPQGATGTGVVTLFIQPMS